MRKITRLEIGFAAGIIVMLANAIIPYQTFGWLSLASESAESAQQVLAATNEVLSAMCRYGGEEFAMIMPEMTLAVALDRASRLREAARLLDVQHGAQPLGRVAISAGIAAFPDHGSDAQGLLQAADAALYVAKESGRDKVMVAEARPQP